MDSPGGEDGCVCKNLSDAVEYIIDVFEEYATPTEEGEEKAEQKICPEKFQTLLKEEFPGEEYEEKIQNFLEKKKKHADKEASPLDLHQFSRVIKYMISGKLGGRKRGGKGKRERREKGRRKGNRKKQEEQ